MTSPERIMQIQRAIEHAQKIFDDWEPQELPSDITEQDLVNCYGQEPKSFTD
jgi:hypothetical protein